MRIVELDEFIHDKNYISQAALYAYKCGGIEGYEAYRAKNFKPSRHSLLGNAVHLLALQPENAHLIVDDLVVNKRTKLGREQYAQFIQLLVPDAIPLGLDDQEKARELAIRLSEHIKIGPEDCAEQRLFSVINDLPVKLAPDLYADDYVADIKTTSQDLSMWMMTAKEKTVWQLAFYAEGMGMPEETVGYVFWLSTVIPQFHLVEITSKEMCEMREQVKAVASSFKKDNRIKLLHILINTQKTHLTQTTQCEMIQIGGESDNCADAKSDEGC